MGAGSDYVAFIHHAGISSLNLGFSKPDTGGVYHSINDTFAWYSRFADPGFTYGKALAQVNVTTLLRLADARVLPYEFTGFARTLSRYLDDLKKLAGKNADRVPLAEIRAEVDRIGAAGKSYESGLGAAAGLPADRLERLNEALMRTERAMTRAQGL